MPRAADGSVRLGGDRRPVERQRLTLDLADDRVGILELSDREGHVIASRIVLQSEDWDIAPDVKIDLRSTAASIILTMPGIATADPYLDALLLSGLESSELLDTAVQRIESAVRDDPTWYVERWDLLSDLVPGLLNDALTSIAADFGVSFDATPEGIVAAVSDHPPAPPAAPATRPASLSPIPTSLDSHPLRESVAGRPSCDGVAMGDLDGVERDGVCFFPVSSPVRVDDPDASQMFVADNRTARWVIVYAGEPAVPVALVPPLRWNVPHVRILLAAIAESWALTDFDGVKDRLDAIGLEYRRDSATFSQQLELRLRPYVQSPLTPFTVPAPLLARGIVTVAFGFPEDDGISDPRLLLGAHASMFLTLTTEFVAPTFAIALNVRRNTEKLEMKALGDDAPPDSCLAGLESTSPKLGGSLLDIVSLPSDRRPSEAEQDCRVARAVRMSLLDAALTFAQENQQAFRIAQRGLADADGAGTLGAVAEAAISAIQTVFIGGLTSSQLVAQVLTVDLFAGDLTAQLRANVPTALRSEFERSTRAIVVDALWVASGQQTRLLSDSDNPMTQFSAVLRSALSEWLGEVFRERVLSRLGQEALGLAFASIAAITRVERVANQALGVANVYMTGRQLLVDLRDYGTYDLYAPVMLDADGQLTSGIVGSFPEILWTISTGYSPDDTTELRVGSDAVSVYQLLINRDDYGRRATVDADGRLIPAPSGRLIESPGGTVITIEDDGRAMTVPLPEVLALAGFEGEEQQARILSSISLFGALKLTGLQREAGAEGRPSGLIAFAIMGGNMPLFDFPNGGVAVVVDVEAGQLVRAVYERELRQVASVSRDTLRLHLSTNDGWAIVEVDGSDGSRRRFGPQSGHSVASLTTDLVVFQTRGGTRGSAVARSADTRMPRWQALPGTTCALVDGSEHADDPSRTCRNVARWFSSGGLIIGGYVQGGFEVRSFETGERLLVDATEYGAEVTSAVVQFPHLFIGDGHGRVRIVDLSVESGDRTGRPLPEALRIGDGVELLPITGLSVRGDQLYVASNASRRLYRYSRNAEGWRQDWLLATPAVVDLGANAYGAYVLRSDGSIMAVR